jgi:TrmH family RNA methyltransferase
MSAKAFESFDEVVKGYDFLVGTTAKVGHDSAIIRAPIFPESLAAALDVKGKVALVFGREDYGLLNEEIVGCDVLVTIPGSQQYPTLNLAQSVGIILYELSRGINKEGYDRKKYRRLDKTEKEYLLRFYDEMIDATYDQEYEKRLAKKTFRSIIGRAFVSGGEAKTMMGVFRKATGRMLKK